MLVVLDTNVVVAGLRSRRGASFALLRRVGTGAFDIAVSVPLVVEYEDACLRNKADIQLSEQEILDVIDYLCSVARRQPIFFLWRPLLLDPKDDMVAEVAFAAGCDAIVTHNARDFKNAQSLGLRIVDPAELLREIGDQ